MAIVINNEIMAKVIDWLNHQLALPTTDCPTISLKELGLDAPALFARQSGGSITNRTVAGSYDVDWPIEFYYRTTSNSEKDVLAAAAILDTTICDFVQQAAKSGNLPDLGANRTVLGFEVNSYSSLVERTEEGLLTYQAVINFRYHQGITM